jgi:hypothetical protein
LTNQDNFIQSVKLTPMLSPHKFETLFFCEVLLDGVVGPLNEHTVQPDSLEHVGHGRTHAERIDCPTVAENISLLIKNILMEHGQSNLIGNSCRS